MTDMVFAALKALALVAALTVDTFSAGLAYGANNIRIPLHSAVVLNLLCSGMLAASLLTGGLIRPLLPEDTARTISVALLAILGIMRLFDGAIKAYIHKRKTLDRRLHFSLFQLDCILHIYAHPEDADWDASKTLSVGETLSLSIALSLDGLAAGFGAALTAIHEGSVIVLSFVFGIAALLGGCFIGKKLIERWSMNLSWLGGLLLLLLAFLK